MRGGYSWLKPVPGLQIPSCPEQSLRERDLHFQWRVIFVEHKLDQVLKGLSSLPQSPACSTPAGSQPAACTMLRSCGSSLLPWDFLLTVPFTGNTLSSRSSCDCSSRASAQVCSQVLTLLFIYF